VLIARMKAVMRRRRDAPADAQAHLRLHDLELHPGRHEVLVAGERIELTSSEFRALHYLAGRPGWVFTRNQIIEAVHGGAYPATDRSVDVLIVGLRRKLKSAGERIQTVRGVGYRFEEPTT
jgi:two-component system phosphate regulon response regulator PhoB